MAEALRIRSDEEQAREASHAKRLLEDEFLAKTLNAMRDSFIETWAKSKPGDHEQREFAYHMLYMLAAFRFILTKAMESGMVVTDRSDAEAGGARLTSLE